MIKLNCFLIAEYAGISVDGKLTIAGTFDSMAIQRRPEASGDAPTAVLIPHAYIVAVTEASLADGLTHQFRLRILNGNGERVMDEVGGEVNYALNAFGRPMRNNLVVTMHRLVLPGPDDYTFELWADQEPRPLIEFVFSVFEAPSEQPNG
jgi:hypothetical protein